MYVTATKVHGTLTDPPAEGQLYIWTWVRPHQVCLNMVILHWVQNLMIQHKVSFRGTLNPSCSECCPLQAPLDKTVNKLNQKLRVVFHYMETVIIWKWPHCYRAYLERAYINNTKLIKPVVEFCEYAEQSPQLSTTTTRRTKTERILIPKGQQQKDSYICKHLLLLLLNDEVCPCYLVPNHLRKPWRTLKHSKL